MKRLVVVGGGVVGLLSAYALTSYFDEVLVLEARTKTQIGEQSKSRTIVLNHQSRDLLEQWGFWPSLEPHSYPLTEVCVQVQGKMTRTRIMADEFDLKALGHVIPLHRIETILTEITRPKIKVCDGARMLAFDKDSRSLHVEQGGQTYTVEADLILGCDGQWSALAKSLHIQTQTVDYEQWAHVAVVSLKTDASGVARELFTKDGAIAFLPMLNHQATLVMTKPMGLNDYEDKESFVSACLTAFPKLKVWVDKPISLQSFPLKMTRACQAHRERALLMGNSAHALHPIAAQGLNLSIRDIHRLKSAFVKFEFEEAIQQYVADSKRDQTLVTTYTHTLASYFSKESLPQFVKALGVLAVDSVPMLKKELGLMNLGANA